MSAPHLLFVFRSSPYGSARAREGLDALLAAAVFEQRVSVLFIGDGVLQLRSDQRLENGRNQHKTLLSLQLYDVENVYFSQSAMASHKIAATDIRVSGTVLSDAEITQLYATVTQVLTF